MEELVARIGFVVAQGGRGRDGREYFHGKIGFQDFVTMKLIDLADHDRASFQVLLAVSDIVTGGYRRLHAQRRFCPLTIPVGKLLIGQSKECERTVVVLSADSS
ncbi:MAG: hypothetical protein P0Y59_07680 [Candidatus Sphingomonas phytovorans]|nr:hypothetical protein [Sphingomonas sp.]WEK01547.1 MAG: hypothetical protein P0Y59_07680 [Sphingomonas sp.]